MSALFAHCSWITSPEYVTYSHWQNVAHGHVPRFVGKIFSRRDLWGKWKDPENFPMTQCARQLSIREFSDAYVHPSGTAPLRFRSHSRCVISGLSTQSVLTCNPRH